MASSENWERLVRVALKRDRTGGVVTLGSIVPPSLGSTANSIERVLQAADDIDDDDPNVARILCDQAYAMARNLDPTSHGTGVLKFKTALASVIKQKLAMKDGASIDHQNDIKVLWNFYLEYKSRRRFDDMQPEHERMKESGTSSTERGARSVEMKRICATLRALLDVLEILVGQATTHMLARQILEERCISEVNDRVAGGGDPTQLHEPPVAEPEEDSILGTEPSSLEFGQEDIDPPVVETSDVDHLQGDLLNDIYQNTTHGNTMAMASLENWERLVRAALELDRAGGLASFEPPSPGSSASIEQVLQAADYTEENDPNVARICTHASPHSSYYSVSTVCEQAYTMARNLYPTSHGRGVLQFKTGMASVIKQKHAKKDGASTDRQDDIAVLWNFYLEHKSRHRLDERQRELERMWESGTFSTEMVAGAVEMKKIYATSRALLDVLELLVGQAPTNWLAKQILEEGSFDTSRYRLASDSVLVAMSKGSSRRKNPGTVITDLPESLIIEILSHLPPKSLCHCKCVSPDWYNLISHPDNLKKLPQTLVGFFFDTKDIRRIPKIARYFQNVSGGRPLIDPSFSFLPHEFERVTLEDSCDGLLLCSCQSPFHLVVCNPTTERWVMVPDPPCLDETDLFALAFDRDISTNFHIFQIARTKELDVAGTKIYSSKTREWSYKEDGWDHREVSVTRRHVFHHGMMHFIGFSSIVALDTEGEKRIIPLPDAEVSCVMFGYVGQSQGHLYYMSQRGRVSQASVWFLENYDTDKWTLKHRVNPKQLLGIRHDYDVISGHPDCSFFYFANHRKNLLMAYDIGREVSEEHEAHVFGNFGRGYLISAFPYVPLYQETLV